MITIQARNVRKGDWILEENNPLRMRIVMAAYPTASGYGSIIQSYTPRTGLQEIMTYDGDDLFEIKPAVEA